MNVLAWIVVGLIAGIMARIAMPGPDPGGVIMTTIVGIVGALIGGFAVFELLARSGGFDLTSVLVATLGSVILLTLYRVITRRAT